MGLKILKYTLSRDELLDERRQEIKMAEGSRILTVAEQRNKLAIWAEEPEPEYENVRTVQTRTFEAVATNGNVPECGTYLGTVLMDDGMLVVHVYEIDVSREKLNAASQRFKQEGLTGFQRYQLGMSNQNG